MARVLVVDDEQTGQEVVSTLRSAGHQVGHVVGVEQALRAIEERAPHVLVTELIGPSIDGLALLRKVATTHPSIACVVLTAFGTVENAVNAMKLGAVEFLSKPLDETGALSRAIAAASERHKLRSRVESTTMNEALNAPQLTFGAPAMKPVVEALKKVAVTNATVLLLGESGTGKEVSARAVHFWSQRRSGPFVAINCAALTESLLEGELFGYERGAFSGAEKRRIGRIEQASGGTFFLDEIGELRPDLQAKLLRVVQERRIQRLGGSESIAVDVRWIAATNRDLQVAMATGQFREDLFHRLAVFPVMLPPLRDRREDVVPMAEKLLFSIGCELGRLGLTIDEAGKAFLRASDWPGNVREMRNMLERASIITDGMVITAESLSASPFQARGEQAAPFRAKTPGASVSDAGKTLEQIEREAIEAALVANGGHRKRTAEALGISLRALYDKLKRYGIG